MTAEALLCVRVSGRIAAVAAAMILVGARDTSAQTHDLAPPVDWSGPYASVSFGAVRSDGEAAADDVGGFLLPQDRRIGVLPDSIDGDEAGAVAGFAVGTNYQSGSWIGGVEAGFNILDLDVRLDLTEAGPFPLLLPPPTVETVTSYRTKIDDLATLRWRGGFATGRNLFFVSAGVAGGHVRNEFGFSVPDIAYEAPLTSDDGLRWGYALAIGFERRVTERVSLRAEVVHFDLEDVTLRGEDPRNFPGEFVEYEFENRGTAAMLGISFSF